MSSDARLKLNEAKYFYEGMYQHFINRSPIMIFYINAFIGSARNVGFVLEKEYAHHKNYGNWNKEHSDQDFEIFKKFSLLRNYSVKERSIKDIQPTITLAGSFEISNTEPTTIPIMVMGKPIPKHTQYTVNGKKKRTRINAEPDFNIEEVVEHGKKTITIQGFLKESRAYLQRLEEMVISAETELADQST